MSPAVIDIFAAMQKELECITGNKVCFEVISGYRTVNTNVNILKASSGTRSEHIKGTAIDFVPIGATRRQAKEVAYCLLNGRDKGSKGGSVYFYPGNSRQFIHVDTKNRGGRVAYNKWDPRNTTCSQTCVASKEKKSAAAAPQ